uniref:Glutathione peroxidase n=1 Tax=Plectus sambesii TaxID=2011161 RepID=A0A914ULI1_9BILA
MLRQFVLAALLASACGAKTAKDTMSDDEEKRFSKCQPTDKTIFDFKVETLTGEVRNLTEFRGKVLLIVNVATYCGYTEQYNHFNQLMERNDGVQLLAFPCNQFHLQEPGLNDEILNGLKYVRPGKNWEPSKNVHIYGKLEVNGENEHPMYKFLKSTCPPTSEKIGERHKLMYDPIKTTDIVWNFEKFLIDRHGRPRVRFFPGTWKGGKRVEKHFKPLLEETAD